ncbi:MAG: DUF4292 domain-containing protein [Saprospiraceae bacterium]|nr:DUF4292 domain-containing protein [Lewinella sp.]
MYGFIKYLPLALLLIAFAACKSARSPETVKEKDLSAGKLLDHMVRNQLHADWLSAKARISYDSEDMGGSATANIVIRKDSLIWVSVRKLGFEVARAQIDQDSMYLLNRLTNEYSIQDLSYLASSYNLPASLKTMQAIFMGNPVFLNTKELTLGSDTDTHHLISTSGQMENQFWLDKASLQLIKASYGDLRNHRNVNLVLDDYRPVNAEQNFSYLRQIKVDSQELGKASIEIDFSDVEINTPQEVRFSIPSRYTRID